MSKLSSSASRILDYVRSAVAAEAEAEPEAREISRLLMSGQMSDDLVLQASMFLKTPVEDMWRLRALLNAIDDDLLANER